ncbi:hypothetical protein [Tropicimonas marinistellae]|uniref:hypothetical protein n=1 Tax=Tropicimonas marinistellae TaxID=1739787 RepID=UPI00082E9D76|nr:hypothetical protein [Tropicimonas marinistellae]
MTNVRRVATAGSVFFVALATGYTMQNGNALAARFLALPEKDAPAMSQPVASIERSGETLPDLALPAEPVVVALERPAPAAFADRTPVSDTGPDIASLAETEDFNSFGLRCETSLTATPGPAATVRLSLSAPCQGGQVATVRHGALRFTETVAPDGTLEATVPALSVSAAFVLTFGDGETLEAVADVPDANTYERVALQWQGQTGLQLHAFEFGADYGDAGHVHAGAAHTPGRALEVNAGFLTRLGRDSVPAGWVSEVYSFPAADARETGAVRISIEAEVTPETCGRRVSAQTLQQAHGTGMSEISLKLAIPGCSAVGEYLVIGDAVPDIQIAAN